MKGLHTKGKDTRNREHRKKLILGCYGDIMGMNLKRGIGKASLSPLQHRKLNDAALLQASLLLHILQLKSMSMMCLVHHRDKENNHSRIYPHVNSNDLGWWNHCQYNLKVIVGPFQYPYTRLIIEKDTKISLWIQWHKKAKNKQNETKIT